MGDVAKDMTGFRSGKLVVVSRSVGPNQKRAYWLCQCDCGENATVMGKYLRSGDVQSCGCLNRQGLYGPSNYRHGHAPQSGVSRTYTTWSGMIERCDNPQCGAYPKYGGRGISVCEQWYEFKNFLADMGERPIGKTIDRYPDFTGNYEPGNCRWATDEEQANNTRRNRRFEYNGETLTLTGWAKRLRINSGTMFHRLNTLPLDVALSPEDIASKAILQIRNRKHGETVAWPVVSKETQQNPKGARTIFTLECGHSINLTASRKPDSIECPACSELWRTLLSGKELQVDSQVKPEAVEILRQTGIRLGRLPKN